MAIVPVGVDVHAANMSDVTAKGRGRTAWGVANAARQV
jgi:hypothetical protein